MRTLARIVIVILSVIAAPVFADFTDGLRAYDGGDYATARSEWQAAAKRGDIDAMNGLAGLYASGFGVRQSYADAARWYERAARRGHITAQLNIGDFYARGRGVKRDLVSAYMWLSVAAKRGSAWSEARRRGLARRMTPTQLADAAARERAFKIEQ